MSKIIWPRPILLLAILLAVTVGSGATWAPLDASLGAVAAPRHIAQDEPSPTPQPPLTRIQAACRTYDPYFLSALQWRTDRAGYPPGLPALVAFTFGIDGQPEQITLAAQDQIGAVYGLAYDVPRGLAYAAAYHKRGAAFGPGGPGAIYVVDLATGRVRVLASLPNGPDRHDLRDDDDAAAMDWVTRAGLGDIDLDDSGGELFASNLADGRIYRLAAADGRVLGSFVNGGAATEWRRNARLFGLAWHEGMLFHGVVDTRELLSQPGALKAYVYRSQPDGSQLALHAQVSLGYNRIPASWASWSNASSFVNKNGLQAGYGVAQPGAILTDLVIRSADRLTLGLRDRNVDLAPSLYRWANRELGAGDTVDIVPDAADWMLDPSGDPYEDLSFGGVNEAMMGGLALMPGGIDQVVSSSRSALLREDVGALRNDDRNGSLAHAVQLRRLGEFDSPDEGPNGMGDMEAMCPPEGAPDVVGPTATSVVATATAGAAATQTAVALLPTSVAQATPADFDRVIADACPSRNPYAATVCFPQLAYLGQNTASIVGFRDTPNNAPHYGLAYAAQVGAVWGLAYSGNQHALFASAFLKRMVPFGPAGPGAVYRVEIPSGAVRTLAIVPDVGADPHNLRVGSDDSRSLPFVGQMSLGDLDLSTDEQELFVVNLRDGRIYRYQSVDGTPLGAFPHGAAGEPWAPDARPFALKFHQGRLYHGLVHSGITGQNRDNLAAYVYSSLADGTDMRLEARVDLRYPRGRARVPGTVQFPSVHDVPLDWQPWLRRYESLLPGRIQMAVWPQPQLVDIEFDDAGAMILGIHDRMGDMSGSNQFITNQVEKPGLGLGDLIRVPAAAGGGWDGAAADPNHFAQPSRSEADRSHVGGLARLRFFDDLLANRLLLQPVGAAPQPGLGSTSNIFEGLYWYDAPGNLLKEEEVCANPILHPQQPFVPPPPAPAAPLRRGAAPPLLGRSEWVGGTAARPLAPDHSEWIPGKGMGDVEVLCGPTSTPPPTAVLSPTPSASATRRPTSTRTPTRSPSATSSRTPSTTPSPRPTRDSRIIFLPLTTAERCDPKRQHIDVVLVIDASTSMRFETRAGRPKIDAAKEAAGRFLSGLAFPDDQAGLVMFNAEAAVLSRLTGDRTAMLRAVNGISLQEFTRIHLGLDLARQLVLAAEHRQANLPAIVLLTDGRSNPDPSQLALDAAWAAKASGIRIFTVGLGQDVEQDVLRAMASRPEDFFHAPDGEDLGAVYDAIAVAIPCPIRGWWPERALAPAGHPVTPPGVPAR